MKTARLATLGSLLLASACAGPPPPDSRFVAQWLRASLAFVRSERLGPPVAARVSAYGSLALYEGYASDPRSRLRSLAGQLNGLASLPAPADGGPVDGAIVAAEAERVVLDSLLRDGFASTRRTIDSLSLAQVSARGAAGISGALGRKSLDHGRAIGNAILAWAATDGFFATRGRPWEAPTGHDQWVNTATPDQFIPQMLSAQSDLVVPTNPAVTMDLERVSEKWVFVNRPKTAGATTLPSFNPVRPTEPYWGTLRPFVVRGDEPAAQVAASSGREECAPPPPPVYSEKPGSDFWKMGKEFYDSASAVTPEKRQVALFWADNPVATGTPGFHWISVVYQMIARRGLSADQAVELYALTSVAISDAFIGCWKEKYRSLVVRPVTYVRRVFDPKFTTVFPTPPFPEYTSGHSVLSGAAVEVIAAVLGDTIPFVDSTQVDIGQAPRPFRSFSAARDEVAVSRVYGGIHYWPAVRDGLLEGKCVGRHVLDRLKTRRQSG